MRKSYLAIGALALLAVLVIAGCGGGGSSSSSSSTTESEPASSTAGTEPTSETAAASETSETTAGTKEEGTAEKSAEGGAAGGGAATAAVVKVTDTNDLGKVIVESKGMTLYDFHKDKGTTSSCYGACAAAWPPLLTSGKPKATGGAESSLLGTTKRKDGTVQVTYKGHPLYGFVEDRKPGETNGNDVSEFGAEWYALEPSGEEPDDDDGS